MLKKNLSFWYLFIKFRHRPLSVLIQCFSFSESLHPHQRLPSPLNKSLFGFALMDLSVISYASMSIQSLVLPILMQNLINYKSKKNQIKSFAITNSSCSSPDLNIYSSCCGSHLLVPAWSNGRPAALSSKAFGQHYPTNLLISQSTDTIDLPDLFNTYPRVEWGTTNDGDDTNLSLAYQWANEWTNGKWHFDSPTTSSVDAMSSKWRPTLYTQELQMKRSGGRKESICIRILPVR